MSAGRAIALWLPVVAWMALLFLLSSEPAPPGAERVPDKLAHVAAYLVLGLLALRATHGALAPPRRTAAALALALTVSYGLLDELHQSLVPARTPSALDWLADAVGAALALGLVALWSRIRGSGQAPRDAG